jgi:hypothetical protein
MRESEATNVFGVSGLSLAATPAAGKADRLGCGQHGGLGRFEQSPFLLVAGQGFEGGVVSDAPASVVDVAPTILKHLGLPWSGLDGRPLQR